MKKLLISKVIIIVIIAIFLMLFGVLLILNFHNKQLAKTNVSNIISMLENIIVDEKIDDFNKYKKFVSMKNTANTIRISIISLNGEVLADTFRLDVKEKPFDDHSNRKEVLEAKRLNDEIGYAIRKSDSYSYDFIYGAKIIGMGDNKIIIRVAIPVYSTNTYIMGFAFTTIIVMFLILMIIIFLFLPSFINVILSPLRMIKNNLDNILSNNFNYTKEITKYDEINSILEEINVVSDKLQYTIYENENEKYKLNYVLENINQGLIALDKNNYIVFINSFALSVFNFIDNKPKYLIEIVRDSESVSKIEHSIEKREYTTFEYFYRITATTLKIEVMPAFDNIHTLIKISDISNAKKLEIEKQELFINASHKLNTPLTSILGYSDILLLSDKSPNNNNLDSPTRDSFMHRINDEALKMKALISDMLKLTKHENSILIDESSNEKIDLKNIIDDVLDDVSIIAKNKNIEINKNIESDCFILANKDDITDIILNLVDNAIKYNRENGIIDITLKHENDKIILIVSDNGIGISVKYLNRVFERFYRVSDASTKNIEGSGLGLSIVKHVCSKYNAKLSLKSQEYIGTEIDIEFKSAVV